MRRLLTYMLATLFLLPFLSSCVHEFPNEDTPAPLTLQFDFDTDLPPYLTITYGTKANIGDDGLHDVRYTVGVYRKLPYSDRYDDLEFKRFVFTKGNVLELNHKVEIDLPDGDYKFLAWVDYVKKGSTEALFYDNTYFKEILLTEPHQANTDYRDAFVGEVQMEVRRAASYMEPQVCLFQMQRPLAKYDFIATDIKEFVAKQRQFKIDEMVAVRGDAVDTSKVQVRLEDYRVEFNYAGYMPSAFNLHSNRPNDAKLGVKFNSNIDFIGNNEGLLGFDYVFVNGQESTVSVAVYVYDERGVMVASTNAITVPLVRSKLTTIRAEFLTSEATGGVGIQSAFDGEFNYEVK